MIKIYHSPYSLSNFTKRPGNISLTLFSKYEKINRMTKHKKTDIFHPAFPLLLGLITTQVIATIHVYVSNVNLFDTMSIIRNSGYLAVPNQTIIAGLKEITAAICAGLFFTLSLGAGLSLLSIAAVWIWDRIFFRHKHLLVLLILIWTGLLLFINIHGFNLFGTLHCIIIPVVVFGLSVKLLSVPGRHQNPSRAFFHLIPIIVLAGLWLTQYDRHLFSDLRDHLLFSNPIGKKVSDFYYAYTLNAAEAFKALNQKMLKTSRIDKLLKEPFAQRLQRALIAYDYLPVETDAPVDLDIIQKGDDLLLQHDERVILKTTATDMLSRTSQILDQFSLNTDRNANLRHFTFLSLLFGYPLMLYVLLHALFWIIFWGFTENQKAAAAASILCFIISLCILGAFAFSRSPKIDKRALADALKSNHWQTRVAALRLIEEQGVEIGRINGYAKSKTSSQIAERYWLAKALAQSRSSETYDDILVLMNDANVNVVSMAYLALARRGDSRAIEEILKKIKVSDNWYDQLYAYRALRVLGWRQDRSQ